MNSTFLAEGNGESSSLLVAVKLAGCIRSLLEQLKHQQKEKNLNFSVLV